MLSFDEMIETLQVGQEYLVSFANPDIDEHGCMFLMVYLGCEVVPEEAEPTNALNFYHKNWKKMYCLTQKSMYEISEARAPHRNLWQDRVKKTWDKMKWKE